MNCAELKESYELYALGLLDGAELAELEAHLNRNCETCMNGIDQAVERNASLLIALPRLEPPAKLRARVLAGFGIETRPFWIRVAPLAAAVCAVLVLIVFVLSQSRRPSNTLNAAAIEWLNTPGVRQFSFGKQDNGPRGSVLLSREKGAMLVVANLPAAPSGKMYETWIVPIAGSPRPTGRLILSEGVHTSAIAGPLDPHTIKAIAVSLETDHSSPQTPSTVVFAAPTE